MYRAIEYKERENNIKRIELQKVCKFRKKLNKNKKEKLIFFGNKLKRKVKITPTSKNITNKKENYANLYINKLSWQRYKESEHGTFFIFFPALGGGNKQG